MGSHCARVLMAYIHITIHYYMTKKLYKFCISLSLFFFFIRPLTCVNTQCVFSGNDTKSIQLSFARSIVIFVYEINFEKKNVEELTIEEE